MAGYRIEISPSLLPELMQMPCAIESRLRRALTEVAEAAAGLPPPGDRAWRNWAGLGSGCFCISVAPWRCTYALDRDRRRVLVLALRCEGPLRSAGERRARPAYLN